MALVSRKSAYLPWPCGELYIYEKTDSTNLRILELAEGGAPPGTVAIAREQTAGRGRSGRSWQSPDDGGLYLSILLKPDLEPDRASMLTLAAAHAICRALRSFGGAQTQIKWPNDIVCNGKKLCGILTEMRLSGEQIGEIVCGFGINVNNGSFPEDALPYATSLFLETGQKYDLEEVANGMLRCLYEDYQAVVSEGDLTPILSSYNRFLVNRGRAVRVLDPVGEYEAQALGINERGELLVKKADGTRGRIYAGEVSVRGIMGYT